MLTPLLSSGLPNLHVLEADLGALDTLRARIEREHAPVIARIVRGRSARTSAAFHHEAAAALQFPAYFGGSWDAFADCAGDLGPCVLMVRLASELLADDPAALATLAAVAAELHQPARPFHLLLQETPGGIATLEARLRAAQLSFARLT